MRVTGLWQRDGRWLQVLLKGGLWLALAGWLMPAWADPVRLGVLAFQGKDLAQSAWQPLAAYLNERLKPQTFEVIPLTYEEINTAVQQRQLELVLTNSEHFVALHRAFALRPLLTQASFIRGQAYDVFSSTVFSRADSGIANFEQVRGRRVAAVGLYSLGGFLAAAHTLQQRDIDLRSSDVASLQFTGVPHQQVVREVLLGKADVGIVRAGVLEGMASRGELNLADVRVLNPNGSGQAFPYAHSTPLVPEWPLAALPHLSGFLAKDVTLALLALQPAHPAARAAQIHGFLPPADYAGVEALMKDLRVFPKVDERPLWKDLQAEYGPMLDVALLLTAVGVLMLAIHLWRQNARLKQMGRLVEAAQRDMALAATAFNSQVGLIVTDQNTRVLRANAALCALLGWPEATLVGQTTQQLRNDEIPPGLLRGIWQRINETGQWEGELPCRHRDGHAVPCFVTIKAVVLDEGRRGFVASFSDLTPQKKTEADIRQLAYYDTLTGIPNRRLFLKELEDTLAKVRHGDRLGALLFIDLDHFKLLNDTHGHMFGDQLLLHIAERLRGALGDTGMVARLGGDEFVVMLTGLSTREDEAMAEAMQWAERMHQIMLRPYRLQVSTEPGAAKDITYHCSGSVGVSLFGTHPEPVAEVLKRADVAMYQAKQAGRNAVRAYEASVQMNLRRKGILSADLSGALARGELSLHYQLQTDAQGRAVGAECLLRWLHPVHGQVSPVEFIVLAEESGAIIDMGDWILASACRTLADWSRHPLFEGLSLSVNVSPRQMIEDNFVDRTRHWLAETGAPAHRLILEITEGIVLLNADAVIDQMHRLCELGVGFSVDDFGTGYSSLSYLQRLPLRQVKIDKAFVRDVTYNPNSEAIVRAILALGHSMHLTVVSEGVETAEQRRLLVHMGCDQLQGYLLGRPVERATLERQLTQLGGVSPPGTP